MSTAAVATLVVLLAISFWRPLRRVRRALGFGHLIASGYGALALGVIAGLAFGGAGDRMLVTGLGPVVAFAAGWIGFAAGSRFERRVLAIVPARVFARALAPALSAAALVGGGTAIVLELAGAPTARTVAGALCLAAVAASAGPTLAAIARTRRARRSRDAAAMLRMVEFSSGIADALVVVLALVAFSLFRTGTEPIPPTSILALCVGGSAVLALALWLFLGGEAGDDERLLLGLGILAMIAGLGAWLEVAPAAVGAIAGAVVANLPGERSAGLIRAVRRVERPVVVILMAVVGMYVAGPMAPYVAILVVALTALRMAGRFAAEGPSRGALEGAPSLSTPAGWTLGLVPQGILGLVIALGFFQVWQDSVSHAVLAAAAIGGLINEALGPLLLVRVVRRVSNPAGEP